MRGLECSFALVWPYMTIFFTLPIFSATIEMGNSCWIKGFDSFDHTTETSLRKTFHLL